MSTEVGQGSGPALRAVAESVHDAIVSADGDSAIVFWNPAAERMFGWSAEEAIGELLTMLMPERYRRSHLEGIARFRQTGQARIVGRGPVELVGLHKGGREFPVELTLGTWEHDGKRWYTGVVRDITERKRVQEQLARAQAELARRRNAQQQAARLHDGVVQSLTLAKYALEGQEAPPVQECVDRALEQARDLVDALLAGIPTEPGSLRRH